MVSWKLYIDSPQQRALDFCRGSLAAGDGYGSGPLWEAAWQGACADGDGLGYGYSLGYGWGDGSGKSYGRGYGTSAGNGSSAKGWR